MAENNYSNEAYVYWFYNKYDFKTYFGSRAAYEGGYKDDFITNYNSSSEDEEFLRALENGELVGEVITVFTGETYEEVGKRAVAYENDLIELYWDNVGKEHSYNHYANGKFSRIGTKQSEEWKKEASIRNSGENNGFYSHHHTEKIIKQISDTKKAQYASGKCVVWNKDKPWDEKTKKQISDTKTAQYASGEVVAWHKNKTGVYSDEVLIEMGKGRKGKKPHNRIELDLDLIKSMYLDENIPVSKIAKTLNVGKGIIINRLKELGIYNPDPRYQGKKKQYNISKEELEDLYCNQKKCIKTIAKIYDIPYPRIRQLLKDYGLYY